MESANKQDYFLPAKCDKIYPRIFDTNDSTNTKIMDPSIQECYSFISNK